MMNPDLSAEPVCRSLFGPLDHDQLHQELMQWLEEIMEQDSQRWNFNFDSDTPLPGQFQWEEVPANIVVVSNEKFAQPEDSVPTATSADAEQQGDSGEDVSTDEGNGAIVSDTHEPSADVAPATSAEVTPATAPDVMSGSPAEATPGSGGLLIPGGRKRAEEPCNPAAEPENDEATTTDVVPKRRKKTEAKSVLNPLHALSEKTRCKIIT